ncbi:MAG TPA: glycosyltransferase family 1 protein [Pyrinomonadaceae bacterium]|nr:glycosyltransferase family 1 protein [Pyrinomonadaceae bacterium]
MHIGLDGLPLTTPKTGVGHYTFELAHALAELETKSRFELLYPSTYPLLSLPDPATVPVNLKLERVQVGPLGRHWWSAGLPRYIRQHAFDLFHGTNYDVPLWRRCATVLTIHDLSVLLHPETHTRRSVRRAHRRLPMMVRTADAIITPAESVRRELCEHLNVAPEKVFAIPEAARECFRPMEFAGTASVRQRLGVGDEFLLAVGTIEPRKNLAVLISAFEEVVRSQPASSLQLVIAGGAGWLSGPVFEAIEKSPVTKRILSTDYLHDDDLRALYASCGAFIYPSLYEGFGLPPLEAMACSGPVIASDIPIFRETLGEAAHFFDPESSHQLSEAIIQVTMNQDLRQRLMSAGLRQARAFSWERTARLTLEVYEAAQKIFVSKR